MYIMYIIIQLLSAHEKKASVHAPTPIHGLLASPTIARVVAIGREHRRKSTICAMVRELADHKAEWGCKHSLTFFSRTDSSFIG